MHATIFGAGNIGRGLVGAVLAGGGYRLTFVDADVDLVETLNSAGHFRLVTLDGSSDFPIESVIPAQDEQHVIEAVSRSELVATAVGEPILRVVAPAIARGLAARDHDVVNVLACENIHPNSPRLGGYIATETDPETLAGVGFPEVVVDRIVPGAGGTVEVAAEVVFEFVVDQTAWSGPIPDGLEIRFTDDIDAYELRKLWLVNGTHATAAWLGLAADHEYIHDTLGDPAIRPHIESIIGTAADALAHRTDEFDSAELTRYAGAVLQRFENADLADLTSRVARNPLQKLAPEERVLGPATAAAALGLDVSGFAAAIASVLKLDAPVQGLDELRAQVNSNGWERFIQDHCNLDEGDPVFEAIKSAMSNPTTERGEHMITEEITIENPAGLHARPAAEIVECAQSIDADVTIMKGDKSASARSIMAVLALGANTGDTVTLQAEGNEASTALESIRSIMQAGEH